MRPILQCCGATCCMVLAARLVGTTEAAVLASTACSCIAAVALSVLWREEMLRAVEHSVPFLPAGKPRYAMGLGTPPQMLAMIARGIDMFDCVMPTRLARHGVAFTLDGPIHIKVREFERDDRPLCETAHPHVAGFSRAFIRHLFRAGEILALRLLSFHNLHFYVRLMRQARQAVEAGIFPQFRDEFLQRYQEKGKP